MFYIMKIHTFYSLWILPLILLAGSSPQNIRQGTNYALFFAVDDYASSSEFGNLKNPVKDANALAKELREMYDFETKVYPNYTQKQIYDVLRIWQNRQFQPEDQLFVFFSGHGDFDDFTSKGYYVARGSRQRGDAAYIDLSTLGNIITKIPCKHTLLAIDACYSGTIDQEIALKGKTFKRPSDNQQSEKNRLIQNQLRNKTRLLITSGGKQRTRDGVNHSPFTEALLRGLRDAYTYRDGLFLYSDLLSELERLSPTPHEGELVGHEQGGFVFVSNQGGAFVPPVPDLLDMVFVKGGTFQVGTQLPAAGRTVGDFYIGTHEVSFLEFSEFIAASNYITDAEKKEGSTIWGPSGWVKNKDINWRFDEKGNRRMSSKHAEYPVCHVSWYDAIAFCNWKSEQAGLQKVYTKQGNNVIANWSANGYRLPTEAEWEFAARSRGKREKWSGTSIEQEKEKYGNYFGPEDGYDGIAKIKSLRPNNLGLYDMSGNVWEWCWDWIAYGYLEDPNKLVDFKGAPLGTHRVCRGGAWSNHPNDCTTDFRYANDPGVNGGELGFRLARSAQ